MIDKLSLIADVATRANIYHRFKPRGESITIRTSFVDVGSDKLFEYPAAALAGHYIGFNVVVLQH